MTILRDHLLGIFLLIGALALVTSGGNIGNAQEESPEQGETGLQVTILLYSGRPNPAFVLDDKSTIDTVKEMVGSSKTQEGFEGETVVPSRLGYNGVVVENLNGTVEQFPASLVIFRGTIEVRNEQKAFLTDEGGRIEDFLLNRAVEEKVIDENTLREIKAGK